MRRISIAPLVAVLLFSVAQVSVAAQRDSGALARITKIYLEPAPDAQPDPQREALARELAKVGFEIVSLRSQADAVLTVFAHAQVVVDGDGSVPNKSIFTYELALPNKAVVWKYRVSFVMKTLAGDINRGATKMAARLLKDKQDSVRIAAHK